MACGKKHGRKLWDNYHAPRTVKSSKYELEDPTVKDHWKRVINEIESPYKDEKFWENSGDEVHELVGEVIYDRLRKIFNLPQKSLDYRLKEKGSTIISSAEYYGITHQEGRATAASGVGARNIFLDSDISVDREDYTVQEVDAETIWSESTSENEYTNEDCAQSGTKSLIKGEHSSRTSKFFSKTRNLANRLSPKYSSKSISSRTKSIRSPPASKAAPSDEAFTKDDLVVHAGDLDRHKRHRHPPRNPYYEMLYCNESETDMITWKSNYKAKKDEFSPSEKFSKGIEIRSRKIAAEFFKWWTTIGSKDYRSEIRKPGDIEALFQLWFDEQASRALILDRKILPCVLKSVAKHFGSLEKSQNRVLEKEILKDIKAERVPPETIAFNASLPNELKHIPPWNNTEKIWHSVRIPEDLRSMACVWEDIRHLRSTKAFEKWLRRHPHLPVPPVFETKQSASNIHISSSHLPEDFKPDTNADLSIPFTNVHIELSKVLSKLMDL